MEYQRAPAAAFSKKLGNGHSFNGKSMYDGVFGGQSKVGSRVEDYAEIFGGGSGSSIPVLDVPELNESKFKVDVSSSKLDYSNIFGGFGNFDFAVSHEDFIAKPTRANQKIPAKTRSHSEGSFSYPSNTAVANQVLLDDQTSLESINGVKQFNVLYSKSSPGSKNGANGTTHVAQLHAVPGYTCLVDEKITPSRGNKPDSSVVNETYKANQFGEGLKGSMQKNPASHVPPNGVSKGTSTVVEELHSRSRSNGSDFNDVLFGAYDVGHRAPPPKVLRASSMSSNVGGNKRDSMKFGVFRSHSLDVDAGASSPPYFDDEVDANSVAATSAAAVKKAIEEAQARLKIAKELMERRKEGHVSRVKVKPSFNGGLRAEERKKSKDSVKQNNFRQDKFQEACEKIDASMQTFAGVNQNDIKVGQVAAASEDGKNFLAAREASGGTSKRNFVSSQVGCGQEQAQKKEAANQGERENEVMWAPNEYEREEKRIIEKPSFNGGLRAEERKTSKDTVHQNNFRQDKVQEICEKIDGSVQTFDGVTKQNEIHIGQVAAASEDGKTFFTAREALGGTSTKNFVSSQAGCWQEEAVKKEAANQGEREKEVMLAPNEYEREEKRIIENPETCGEKAAVEEPLEQEVERKPDSSKELCDKDEFLNNNKSNEEFDDRKEDETKLRFSEMWEDTETKMSNDLEACERKLKEPEKPAEDERKDEMQELKDIDNMEAFEFAQDINNVEKHKDVLKQEEGGCGLEDVSEKEENEMLLPDADMQREFGETSEEAFEISELNAECIEASGPEEEEDACNRKENEQMSDKKEKPEIIDLRHDNFDDKEDRERSHEENDDLLGNEEFMEAEENGDMFEDAYQMEEAEEGQEENPESVRTGEMQKQADQRADKIIEAREDALECFEEDLEAANGAYECDKTDNVGENLDSTLNEDSCEMIPELLANQENGGIAEGSKTHIESEDTRRDTEAVEVANNLEENLVFDKVGLAESNFKLNGIEQQSESIMKAFDFDRNGIDIDTADISFEQKQYEQRSEESEIICTVENHVEELVTKSEEDVKEAEVIAKQDENKFNFGFPDMGRWVDSQLHCKSAEKHETATTAHEIETSQSIENNVEGDHEILTKEDKETKNHSQEVELVKEQQRRVDEAKEREKEREKERIAVERAIREARERAFKEARERAAAGRTNVEARRKLKAEAQGESAKPSAEANDKALKEAKLKAERAAVERATAEARQRALEKALSEKAAFGARNQAEGSSDAKQSFQSYDSRYNKGSCPPGTGRYPNSSNQNASNSSEGLDGSGATGESAQRCKARLERHQRTAERAAKALAEKNKRDLLAQKEQAERNRLAETLDAEVKRWSSGKQGNLRALLSTLQYILGSDSGWQPIPLTEIIAAAAVKKAYRKATLCVHPDKLQQRGASIQQKYICEKVFDLLKEAWNKFSAEER